MQYYVRTFPIKDSFEDCQSRPFLQTKTMTKTKENETRGVALKHLPPVGANHLPNSRVDLTRPG